MKGLLLRLSGLDADAANAVRVIGFFDRLITARVGLETLVRSTAQLAECPVGVSAPGRGLTLRAEPGADAVVSGRVPGRAASRALEDATVVWVARDGTPSPLDDMLLERFAIATAVLLDHASVPLPALGDPALVELVLSDGVGTAERSRALHLLGLDPMGGLRVVAGFGVDAIDGRAAALGPARALLVIGAIPDVPPGGLLGVGPRVPAIEAARSWQAARTALRFAADSEPIVWWSGSAASPCSPTVSTKPTSPNSRTCSHWTDSPQAHTATTRSRYSTPCARPAPPARPPPHCTGTTAPCPHDSPTPNPYSVSHSTHPPTASGCTSHCYCADSATTRTTDPHGEPHLTDHYQEAVHPR